MKKPYIIAINAVSGGGKTALATCLSKALPKSALFCFDDFDSTNIYPDDYYEWSQRGANLLEFDCPGMGDTVQKKIKQEQSEYIILDYPFGRDHPRFQNLIDLSVFIDTPLDVAMARRTLRDFLSTSEITADEKCQKLRTEMVDYIKKARYPYLDALKCKKTCDLILDGWTTLENLRDKILEHIKAERSRERS
ncbi:MAG: hypothetical protein HQ525_04075 [Anaerolineae bacterium]|nr:hypothetical protein [Anaerolineae bacterium]